MQEIEKLSVELAPAALDAVRRLCCVESSSYDVAGLAACADLVLELATEICGAPESVQREPGGEQGDILVLTYPGTEHARVGILAHYDTVWPAGTLEGWEVVDLPEKLSLPGVLDMKAGLVQGLYALRLLQLLDLPRPSLTFVFNGDEEIGSPTSRPVIERVCADLDATIVLEPAGRGGAIKTDRKGIGILNVEVRGVEAHAGLEPEKGASAIHELAAVIERLTPIGDPDAGTTINVGTVSGGSGSNVVAGRANAMVDVRVLSQEEQARVDRQLAEIGPRDERTLVSFDMDWNRPPMTLTDSSVPLLELVQDAATELGRPLDTVTVGGASDANFIAGLGGAVLCGLGAEGEGPHARGEYIDPRLAPFRLALTATVLTRLARTPI